MIFGLDISSNTSYYKTPSDTTNTGDGANNDNAMNETDLLGADDLGNNTTNDTLINEFSHGADETGNMGGDLANEVANSVIQNSPDMGLTEGMIAVGGTGATAAGAVAAPSWVVPVVICAALVIVVAVIVYFICRSLHYEKHEEERRRTQRNRTRHQQQLIRDRYGVFSSEPSRRRLVTLTKMLEESQSSCPELVMEPTVHVKVTLSPINDALLATNVVLGTTALCISLVLLYLINRLLRKEPKTLPEQQRVRMISP